MPLEDPEVSISRFTTSFLSEISLPQKGETKDGLIYPQGYSRTKPLFSFSHPSHIISSLYLFSLSLCFSFSPIIPSNLINYPPLI